MCLIIAKPQGAIVPFEHVKNAYAFNKDGIGISVRGEKPSVEIKKFLSLAEFEAQCGNYLADESIEAVVHLRYATHGSASLKNVHPFRTSHGHALHHNGIIDIKTDGDMTDSECFKRAKIDPMPSAVLTNPTFRKGIEQSIKGSKLALHTSTGIILFNEASGHWFDGVWYSNSGYKSYDLGWNRYDLLEDDEVTDDDILEFLELYLPGRNGLARKRAIRAVSDYLLCQSLEWGD